MYRLCLFIFLFSTSFLSAQKIRQPFDFRILLSGNFGELRNNHFHAGIDFKTEGVEGKPVHAVQKGYVSRIVVSPGGYGNGLYLTHPNGTTTVYGHLQRFVPEIAEFVKEQQYLAENFSVDLKPAPGQFSFSQGEIIAYSGNSGSSGGPHLHFEVRDTRTEEVLDPIKYFKKEMVDTRPPKILSRVFCAQEGAGVVNGGSRKIEQKVITNKNGRSGINGKIQAWGAIGVAIKAYDYMNNTSNIYGIKEILLTLDGDTIFNSDIERFSFAESRYLNSFTDYAEWKERRSFYMRSFVEPGNRLRFIKSKKRGLIRIDEERAYKLQYTLKDAFGNVTRMAFVIEGKKQEIPQPQLDGAEQFARLSDNRFNAKGIRLFIPKESLYDNLLFRYVSQTDSSDTPLSHSLHNHPVALHTPGTLSLRLPADTLPEKRQYGIVRLHKNRTFWIGGDYRNGWINASIRELGTYAVGADTESPEIKPILQSAKNERRKFAFRLTDTLSGIAQYRGEIDGEFALFEMDNQSVVTYIPDNKRLKPGKHRLRLIVNDAAGNQSVHEETFTL